MRSSIATRISSHLRRDVTEWGRRLNADAAALVHPVVGVQARRALCEPATGAMFPPAIARNVVGGTTSEAHWAPQLEHASS